MLREQLWFDFCDDLPIEIEQRIDEGILEAERFKERAEQVKEMPRGAARTAAGAELLEQLCALENPQDKDEPSDLPGIKAASVGEPKEKAEADCDKIYGAWLGRCAGCLLGQPVEGWRRAFERDRQPAVAKLHFVRYRACSARKIQRARRRTRLRRGKNRVDQQRLLHAGGR